MIGIILFLFCAWLGMRLIDKVFDLVEGANDQVPVTRYMEPQHLYRIAIEQPSYYRIAEKIRKQFSDNTEVVVYTGSAGQIQAALQGQALDVAIVPGSEDISVGCGYTSMYAEGCSDDLSLQNSDVTLYPLSHAIESFRIIFRAPLLPEVESSGLHGLHKRVVL